MKKQILFILVFALAASVIFSACSPRTLPEQDTHAPQENSQPEEKLPSQPEEQPSVPEEPEENTEDSKEDEKKDDEEALKNSPQSGTFLLMNSGYQIQLSEPFQGIYNPADGGFYVSVKDDSSFQGIIAYLTGEDLVSATEADIADINEALAKDPAVFDFKYDRQKQDNGMYYITFTYTNAKSEGSESGFSYVHYQKTPNGILSVMFNCPRNDYDSAISAIFQSVVPATEEAVEAPSRG